MLGADPTEILAISLDIGPVSLTVVNIYIPPISSCPPGFTASIAPYSPSGDSLVLGDFNAHNDLWCSYLAADSREKAMADALEQAPFAVLNKDSPTRLPPNGAPSSPDVSLASLSLIASTTWST
ncbi:unnamed protein product [Dibothriocephalus latus]|uniref:Endonuclease/exonuclease/phosphatase domain-containing protein n=1 Tax=Dibothriocephalus latus TaxID=60516 RepID=A0A3P7N154_DIBLA|nr:unnamed protein product [Dibothriocephalus latus]